MRQCGILRIHVHNDTVDIRYDHITLKLEGNDFIDLQACSDQGNEMS